jgi:hypothetical protein
MRQRGHTQEGFVQGQPNIHVPPFGWETSDNEALTDFPVPLLPIGHGYIAMPPSSELPKVLSSYRKFKAKDHIDGRI